MQDRVCQRCGKVYNPDGWGQKWCQECRPAVMLEQKRVRDRRAYAKRKEEQAAARKQRQLDHKGE